MKRILLIAPWWSDGRHVGNRRLARHVNWLTAEGHQVTIVCAGPEYSMSEDSFGTVIRIPDPLGVMGPNPKVSGTTPRRPNALRRWLAYATLVPDLSIVWSRRVMAHPIVRHQARTSDLITASSPPEAPFLAAVYLSERLRVPFWMDMRDGWLDEPLKPLLRDHAWQRWRERRLEARCLRAASVVTVNSPVWKRMLLSRYPEMDGKTHVVTNASPDVLFDPAASLNGEWVYAGRFGSSRPERSTATLARLLNGIQLTVVGDLTADELDDVRRHGWVCKPEVDAGALPEYLNHAAGLVLLSESMGSIPAKLFEYLAAGRPILAVCPAGSATHEALKDVNHATILHPEAPDQASVNAFATATKRPGRHPVPHRFTEPSVRTDLMAALEGVWTRG